jgi:PAS domain S-box-containing protein
MQTDNNNTPTMKHMQAWSQFDNRSEGIAVLDTDGIICYLNPAWRHLLGARDADAFRIGNGYINMLYAIFDPETYGYVDDIARCLQMVVNNERDQIELEYPHNRAGHWRWYALRISQQQSQQGTTILIEQTDITNTLHTRAVGES